MFTLKNNNNDRTSSFHAITIRQPLIIAHCTSQHIIRNIHTYNSEDEDEERSVSLY